MQYFKRTATIKKVSETEYQLVTTDTNEVLKTGTLVECDTAGIQFYIDQLGENGEQKLIDIMKDFVNKNKSLLDTYSKLKSKRDDH